MLRKRLVAPSALLLLVILILSQSGGKLHARTLTLAGVSANLTDLTASTNMRRDLNGEPCALLKVAFNKPGLAFEGNVIGDVSYSAGEYFVYVTANTRFLKVKHQEFDPLEIDFKLTEVGPLEGKKVYMVKLQAEGEEGEPVTFIVRPAEAELMVDLKIYPTVDGRAEIPLTPGEHSYAVASPGYEMQGMRFMVYADSPNRHVIELDRRKDNRTSNTTVATLSNMINGHEYVDLGLPSGLKWATCNVGADSPSDYGEYFAWGETTPKSEYTEENSKTLDKEIGDISGDPNYDTATANWGGSWRMPTEDELDELKEQCQWTWTKLNGHTGYKVIGTNGKSIFLPAAGYASRSSFYAVGLCGDYWSTSDSDFGREYAKYLHFTKEHYNGEFNALGNSVRCIGFSVRPVSN